jgi:hypothetical protein
MRVTNVGRVLRARPVPTSVPTSASRPRGTCTAAGRDGLRLHKEPGGLYRKRPWRTSSKTCAAEAASAIGRLMRSSTAARLSRPALRGSVAAVGSPAAMRYSAAWTSCRCVVCLSAQVRLSPPGRALDWRKTGARRSRVMDDVRRGTGPWFACNRSWQLERSQG